MSCSARSPSRNRGTSRCPPPRTSCWRTWRRRPGLVLRNVRLTAELQATIDDLRASRRRLVKAQDEERQRIERNLHDGAQQQLVALTVQLSLLEDAAEDSGEVRQMTGQLRAGLHAALDDLRALARGIYPPLLADQGLGPPCERRPAGLRCPSRSRPTASGATRADAEAAVYFCTLEALQNIAKYARASQATVALSCPDSHLEFTVTDDGGRLRHRDGQPWHRPAGHGRPAGRGRRHPPHQLRARARHHHQRQAARIRASRDRALAAQRPRVPGKLASSPPSWWARWSRS